LQADSKYAQILSNLSEQAIPNHRAIAFFLLMRGNCLLRLHQYNRVIQYDDQARGLINQSIDPHLFASINDQEAAACEGQFSVNHDARLIKKASLLRETSISIYDAQKDYAPGALDQFRTLACDYSFLKQQDKAIPLFRRTIQLYASTHQGRTAQCAWTIQSLADLFGGMQRWDEALKEYQDALPVYQSTTADPLVIQRVRYDCAYCLLRLKHPEKAETILQLVLAEKCNDLPLRQLEIQSMFEALSAQNKMEQAKQMEKQLQSINERLKKS